MVPVASKRCVVPVAHQHCACGIATWRLFFGALRSSRSRAPNRWRGQGRPCVQPRFDAAGSNVAPACSKDRRKDSRARSTRREVRSSRRVQVDHMEGSTRAGAAVEGLNRLDSSLPRSADVAEASKDLVTTGSKPARHSDAAADRATVERIVD
jgi:hypothetical protein